MIYGSKRRGRGLDRRFSILCLYKRQSCTRPMNLQVNSDPGLVLAQVADSESWVYHPRNMSLLAFYLIHTKLFFQKCFEAGCSISLLVMTRSKSIHTVQDRHHMEETNIIWKFKKEKKIKKQQQDWRERSRCISAIKLVEHLGQTSLCSYFLEERDLRNNRGHGINLYTRVCHRETWDLH